MKSFLHNTLTVNPDPLGRVILSERPLQSDGLLPV